jgi:hypothetical protein
MAPCKLLRGFYLEAPIRADDGHGVWGQTPVGHINLLSEISSKLCTFNRIAIESCMVDLDKLFLYRITHIENIPHVLQHGITHASSPNRNNNFVPIGDNSLISTRAAFALPNGHRLGEYIPFYFGPRMPMLYVIQKGFNTVKAIPAKEIVYCITTVGSIITRPLDYYFTNGHAIDSFTEFFDPADINNLDSIVDFKAVSEKYWSKDDDLDLKRRKEAEFLVLGDIPGDAVLGFAVSNDVSAQAIGQMPGCVNKRIVVKPNYYF